MEIQNEHGSIKFDYKTDLNQEEGSDRYLPRFYEGRVIELKFIEAAYRGGGKHLMKAFLEHPMVKQAGLVFLDICPHFLDVEENQAMQKLHTFYARFGFQSKHSSIFARMWRVQDKPSDVSALFALGYCPENDLHCVLESSLGS